MKRIITFILAVVMVLTTAPTFVLAANSGIKTYDSTKYATKYVLVKKSWPGGDSFTYEYDSKGNLKKRAENYDYGKDIYTFSYDAKGNLIKSVSKYSYGKEYISTYDYDASGNLISSKPHNYKYFYNASGLLSKMTYSTSETGKSTTTFTYDENKRIINITSKGGHSSRNTTFIYDNNGNIVKQKDEKDGTITLSRKYDSNGNLIKGIYSNGNYSNVKTYAYDSKGNMIKKNDEGYIFTYKYNSKGKLIKQIWDRDGDTDTTYYYYDKNGNLVKETDKYSDGSSTTYTFSYKKMSSPVVKIPIDCFDIYDEGNTFFKLNYSYCIYNGKKRKPVVTSNNYHKGADYKVQYFDNVNPGKGKILISFTNGDSPIIITFDIKPHQVTDLETSSVNKTSLKLSWSKIDEAKYYRIQQSSDGKTWKTVTRTKNNSAVIDGLKKGTKYQFRVCALDATKKVAGKYSAVKTVTTKK